jgi:hypothetical protein
MAPTRYSYRITEEFGIVIGFERAGRQPCCAFGALEQFLDTKVAFTIARAAASPATISSYFGLTPRMSGTIIADMAKQTAITR